LIADTQIVFKNYNYLVAQIDKLKSFNDDIEHVSYKEVMQLIVEMTANIASNLTRIRSCARIYDANFRKIDMRPKLNVSFIYSEHEEDGKN